MPDAQHRKRILFGQLASSGDCLLVTPLVRQIKEENPNCHLTWAIGSAYKKILDGNPYIDDIWEIELRTIEETQPARENFEKKAMEKLEAGEYDEVIITDFTPKNYQKYFLTTRSFLFRSFGRKVKVPVNPIIFLSDEEKLNVKQFVEKNNLNNYKNVILFESAPKSGQSRMTSKMAKELALNILNKHTNTAVILSSNLPIENKHGRLLDASTLSFRENAELTKYCSLLIGCSSGISWIMTSTAAKLLPTIQLINQNFSIASMTMDHDLLNLSSEHIIEIPDIHIEEVIRIVDKVFSSSFLEARSIYNNPVYSPVESVPRIVKRLIKFRCYQEFLDFINLITKIHSKKTLFFSFLKSFQNRIFTPLILKH